MEAKKEKRKAITEEGQAPQSRKDFIAKYAIALKEAPLPAARDAMADQAGRMKLQKDCCTTFVKWKASFLDEKVPFLGEEVPFLRGKFHSWE
jgi:hypothetical protein